MIAMTTVLSASMSAVAIPVWLTPRPNTGFWVGVVVAVVAWLWLRRRLRMK